MKKQDIENIIRDLFRQNFNAYPDNYPTERVYPNFVGSRESGKFGSDGSYLIMSEQGTTQAQEVAKGYWAERNEDEIERDEKAGVTEIDYVEWVMAELSDLIPAAK